jgi:hypothetical protein
MAKEKANQMNVAIDPINRKVWIELPVGQRYEAPPELRKKVLKLFMKWYENEFLKTNKSAAPH